MCVLCFKKTETVEKEEGDVILCEKCKEERTEGNFETGTGGVVIGRFEETIVYEHKDFEESKHNIQINSDESDNKETQILIKISIYLAHQTI